MLTWREVWGYLQLLLRWTPVLIVAMLLSAGTAWMLTRNTPNYYVAHASVQVGNNFSSNTPSNAAVEMSNTLANYYAVLVRREVIMGPVVERLGVEIPWEYIATIMLSTEVNPQANLLEIRITDSNPERAAAIANAISDQLIAYSPNAPDKIAAEREAIESQIAETKAVINDLDKKIADLEQRQESLSSAIDLRDVAEQIDKLKLSRESYQSTYNQLLALRGSSTANSLSSFERASVPLYPLPQRRMLIIGIAALGGLILAIGAVLVLDFLDTRWRPGRDAEGRSGITHLGRVRYRARPRFGTQASDAQARQQDVRETYTNMVLQAHSHVPRTILVSSPQPSEPRSAFAIDLAGVYAQSGLRVLLVDAELAKPHVTRLLLSEPEDGEAPRPDQGDGVIKRWASTSSPEDNLPPELWVRLRPTPLMNVMLLPSHHEVPDTLPVLVPSLHWPELVRSLQQTSDIVIFDGPSLLTGADSALLAPLMDGVVLALNPSTDTRSDIAASKKRLMTNEGTRLLGAVTVEQNGSRVMRRAASRAEKPPWRSGFGISFDSRGVTLTLPALTKQAEPVDTNPPPQQMAPMAPPPPRQPHQSEVAPTWEELRDRSLSCRAVGEPWPASPRTTSAVVTPPPMMIVTPPPVVPIITPVVVEPEEQEPSDAAIAQSKQPPARPRRPTQSRGKGPEPKLRRRSRRQTPSETSPE